MYRFRVNGSFVVGIEFTAIVNAARNTTQVLVDITKVLGNTGILAFPM
jgi:hypothetical protein